MKPIDKDFQPDERSLGNLRKWISLDIYMFRDFIDWELPNFITYFTETKAKKRSWQMTFQRWMRTAWTGKAGRDWEYDRHKRYSDVVSKTTNITEIINGNVLINGNKQIIKIPTITPAQSIERFNQQCERFKNN